MNLRQSALTHLKILIVDDESSIVEVLARLLKAAGYQNIASTTDPFAALPLFQSFAPDLVILDFLMPRLNGLEVLAQLRASISADTYLPILFLTGDQRIGSRREALKNGATDFVIKPCDPSEFCARIRNLLDARHLHLQLSATNARLEAEALARRRIEQNLQEAKEAAERANAAKSEFLSRMSHELRTPLNAILGFGQILEMEGRDPDEADSIDQILKAGRHLLGMVDELLAISQTDDPLAIESISPPAVSQGFHGPPNPHSSDPPRHSAS